MGRLRILSEAEFDRRCSLWQFRRWQRYKRYRVGLIRTLASQDPPQTLVAW